jgi:hypothetical protein
MQSVREDQTHLPLTPYPPVCGWRVGLFVHFLDRFHTVEWDTVTGQLFSQIKSQPNKWKQAKEDSYDNPSGGGLSLFLIRVMGLKDDALALILCRLVKGRHKAYPCFGAGIIFPVLSLRVSGFTLSKADTASSNLSG